MASPARVNLGSNKFSPSRTAQNGANMVNELVKAQDERLHDELDERDIGDPGAQMRSACFA
ncbi:uncharacterized protein BBA_00831 [Beauveria bassiana ARSEF 2860]|uniref:Uncharacterized protein n=1 Tax=Beauveria bassiana (strain ARSEF 2860) TaxID=655819 RepID=J4UV45_BEAB2|nr:uncharacterized protein BBA_00831 [Beauveria bassiana ARSEF 2860]EJP69962.1 hypothetical protein BBA_00831 [Beauveria bassiana ARSEF 2860]